ncbi:uncharacterized protein LOC126235886 isoform X1 [Schistocerca nitens]|uniref:uncharacterized protein LOC126235886 isoform X1 n=1 Tax=Schistocerca nitens TaxID=7011 RepID=UPI002117B31D|nr:uncharacterized protein LOC126235886 isoform X1 [Schistocerca nitens]
MTSTNERRQLEMELTDLIDAENLRGKDAALAYNNRGHLRYLQVNFDGAIEDYDKAIANDPDLAVAYYNRGTVFYRLGSNINSARWIGSVSKFFLLMNFSMTVFSLDFCMCDVDGAGNYEGGSESNLRLVTVRVVGGVATPSVCSRTQQVSRHQAVVE